MLATKYIIRKTNYFDGDKYLKGDVCYTYFAGYAGDTVPCFDSNKKRAMGYATESEATFIMNKLKAAHSPILFAFSIIPVRYRA